jgi:hypothetical protein
MGATTPLAGLRKKELWDRFVQQMTAGLSVRKAAAAVGVHPNTSFRWRHRFLKVPAAMQATSLKGVVEADETLFRTSQKGTRHPSIALPVRSYAGAGLKIGNSAEHP